MVNPKLVAYIRKGIQRGFNVAYIKDIKVTEDDDGQKQYEPQIATIARGFVLRAMATANADRTHVTMELEPKLIYQVGKMEQVPYTDGPAKLGLFTEKSKLEVLHLSTRVSILDKGTLLVVLGRSKIENPFEFGENEGQPETGADERMVLLLVKPRIIELAAPEE